MSKRLCDSCAKDCKQLLGKVVACKLYVERKGAKR